MKIETAAAGLAGMTKELMREWDETKAAWRDAKAVEFEHDRLSPVTEAVANLAIAASKLDRILSQVQTDCE
jgi:hypothetical protein